MKERLEKYKEETIKIKVEPQTVDPDDPLTKPLKIILPGRPKPMGVPHTSSVVTPLSKKGTKGKRGEAPSEKTTEVKKSKRHKK